MLTQATTGESFNEKLRDVTKVSVAILIILTIAALAGIRLLHQFGVSLDAFMVAGGGVLAWMGFGMLSKDASGTAAEAKSLTPVIMFGASPGTITGVITISAAHTQLALPVTALIAIVIASITTWVTMLLAAKFSSGSTSVGFLQDTTTRFMGLIVLAMGMQFALTGYQNFMK
jgi:multiple antibiotic resistance protein